MQPDSKDLWCEYRRCGGAGRWETRLRWGARIRLWTDKREWLVCEGCADLLTGELRQQGLEVGRSPILEPRANPPDGAPTVTIWTDVGCTPNPGCGGFGVVLYDAQRNRRREISAGFRHTTNNRMELYAAIAGLEALKYPCAVTLYSDFCT
jgi:hypothetical protein